MIPPGFLLGVFAGGTVTALGVGLLGVIIEARGISKFERAEAKVHADWAEENKARRAAGLYPLPPPPRYEMKGPSI